jgi:amidase
VPLGVKDLLWMRDIPTAAGMPIHAAFRPGSDATAVARLRGAGAVILGKQQMTEGAYSDYHPSITAPVNPWGSALWPGISSSGPAVATAAGLCYGTIASDTGGSIRWPCAATGLTGIKPPGAE